MMRRARPLWEEERDRYRAFVTDAELSDPATMSPTELLANAELAWRAAGRHLAVFQLTGASAALSEMLLTRLWERDKRRRRAQPSAPRGGSTRPARRAASRHRDARSVWARAA